VICAAVRPGAEATTRLAPSARPVTTPSIRPSEPVLKAELWSAPPTVTCRPLAPSTPLIASSASPPETRSARLESTSMVSAGAGRGIGREHALLFAAEGAAVMVNDLGGGLDGAGADVTPAQQVVDEISAAGGEAIADGHDVSDFEGARQMVDAAVERFGRVD